MIEKLRGVNVTIFILQLFFSVYVDDSKIGRSHRQVDSSVEEIAKAR